MTRQIRGDVMKDQDGNDLSRRAVLLTGGSLAVGVVLTGCVVEQAAPPAAPNSAPAGQASSAPPGQQSSAPATQAPGGASALTTADKVPAGGGVVLGDQKMVITRDSGGTARAFSAVCTHQGCLVSSVEGGTINCRCHGSKFDVSTGQPVDGPAKKPLPPIAVEERDGAIFPA
jgi:Rieske Fe-S protein